MLLLTLHLILKFHWLLYMRTDGHCIHIVSNRRCPTLRFGQIIDLSNNEVQTEVIKSLNTNQIDWINKVLSKKVWNQTREFQQYISQFNEDVSDRVHIPV